MEKLSSLKKKMTDLRGFKLDAGFYIIHGHLPGASDSSRVQKESGTVNSEAPKSTSRMAVGLSTGKQSNVMQQRCIIKPQNTLKTHYVRKLHLIEIKTLIR